MDYLADIYGLLNKFIIKVILKILCIELFDAFSNNYIINFLVYR